MCSKSIHFSFTHRVVGAVVVEDHGPLVGALIGLVALASDETIKTSSFKCFTCGGQGHKSYECTNKRTMILNDDGTYDSMSEEEMEALEQVAMHWQVNNEDDQIFCDEDSSPALVVSKVLTLQHQQDEDQRCHIFHTKAGIKRKVRQGHHRWRELS